MSQMSQSEREKLKLKLGDEMEEYDNLTDIFNYYCARKVRLDEMLGKYYSLYQDFNFILQKEDVVVHKLVGGVLVKEDFDEVKASVNQKIEFFERELERVDEILDGYDWKGLKHLQAINKLKVKLGYIPGLPTAPGSSPASGSSKKKKKKKKGPSYTSGSSTDPGPSTDLGPSIVPGTSTPSGPSPAAGSSTATRTSLTVTDALSNASAWIGSSAAAGPLFVFGPSTTSGPSIASGPSTASSLFALPGPITVSYSLDPSHAPGSSKKKKKNKKKKHTSTPSGPSTIPGFSSDEDASLVPLPLYAHSRPDPSSPPVRRYLPGISLDPTSLQYLLNAEFSSDAVKPSWALGTSHAPRPYANNSSHVANLLFALNLSSDPGPSAPDPSAVEDDSLPVSRYLPGISLDSTSMQYLFNAEFSSDAVKPSWALGTSHAPRPYADNSSHAANLLFALNLSSDPGPSAPDPSAVEDDSAGQ